MNIAEKLTTVVENVPKVYEAGKRVGSTTLFSVLAGEDEEIVLPEGLTSLRDYAFGGYYNLKRLTIPKSVEYIGAVIVSDSWGTLEEITLPFLGTDRENSDGCAYLGNLYGGQNDWLPSSLTKVTLTDCLVIYANSFVNCYYIEEIVLPDGLTEIENDAFANSPVLSKINIPESVLDIGYSAFAGTDISEIIIPNGVQTIPMSMCDCCYSLKNVVIPNTVTDIEDYAFDYTSLKEITIPSSVKYIGSGVFDGCQDLVIKYDGTLMDWYKIDKDDSYFADYNITVEALGGIGEPITYEISDDSTYAIVKRCDTGMAGVVEIASEYEGLPVTKIADYAFEGCYNLYNVIIPNTITEIGDGIFKGCSSLGWNQNYINFKSYDIIIPDSVTKIGRAIFDGTSSLNTITLPFIGDSLNSENKTIGYLFGDNFDDCMWQEGDIYITIKQHSANINGNTFNFLKQGYTCVINLDLSSCDFTTIEEGSFSYWEYIGELKLPNTVTTIGEESFNNAYLCYFFVLPSSLTSIGAKAFNECGGFQKVTISENVESIGSQALNVVFEWSAEKTIYINNSDIVIADDAFSSDMLDIYVPWGESEGKVPDNKWGAVNATIHYNYSE